MPLLVLGFFRVISAFCDTSVAQNAEITRKIPSTTSVGLWCDILYSESPFISCSFISPHLSVSPLCSSSGCYWGRTSYFCLGYVGGHMSLCHEMPRFFRPQVCRVGNFRVHPRFHPTTVGWNLGWTREFPSPTCVSSYPWICHYTSCVLISYIQQYSPRILTLVLHMSTSFRILIWLTEVV